MGKMRRVAVAVILSSCVGVGGAACGGPQLPGPPLVIEMPEIGASVDVSGFLYFDEDPDGVLYTKPVLEPVKPGRMRLTKQKVGVDVRFLGGKLPYPYVRVRGVAPREPKREPWTLDTCVAFFQQRDEYGTVAWSAGTAEVKVVNGLQARIVPIDSTERDFVIEQRARVLVLAKPEVCYGIETAANRTLWDKQEKLLAKVLDSVKPLQ